MNNHPIKFILKLSSKLGGIFPYGVHAYKKVSRETVTFAVVESDDVSEIVVLKKLLIDVQNIVVGTENYGDIPYSENLAFGRKFKPLVCFPPVTESEVSVLEII